MGAISILICMYVCVCHLVCFNDDWWQVAVFRRQGDHAVGKRNRKALVFVVPMDLCHRHWNAVTWRTTTLEKSNKFSNKWGAVTSLKWAQNHAAMLEVYNGFWCHRLEQNASPCCICAVTRSFRQRLETFLFSRSYQDTIIWLMCYYHHSSLLSGHLWSLQ